jgi:hypothetical protein
MSNQSFIKTHQSLRWVGVAFFLTLVSCVSGPKVNSTESEIPQSIFRIRFQNMLGLKLYQAGCSFQNLGGVERMCQFALQTPADLVFQVGPSFSELLGEKETPKERVSKRRALWKVWEIQQVGFYSVDFLDLIPNLKEFQSSHEGSPISLLSSNLVSKTGKSLFIPFLTKEFLGKKIVFLSFSEKPQLQKDKDWRVEEITVSFKNIQKQVEPQADIFYILGSLSSQTRLEIASLTAKPILFFGGALEENNSTHIESLSEKAFNVRSASFGRGFGDLALGKFQKDFWGRDKEVTLGGLDHSFWAYLLESGELKFNECSKALKTTKPQSLATEALEIKQFN